MAALDGITPLGDLALERWARAHQGHLAPQHIEQLRELIEAKLDKGDAVDTAETFGDTAEAEGGGEVLDLMEALRRSVEKNRAAASSTTGTTKSTKAKAAPSLIAAKPQTSWAGNSPL